MNAISNEVAFPVKLIISLNAISNEVAFPVKWTVSLNVISNKVAFSCEVAYMFPIKWPFSCKE